MEAAGVESQLSFVQGFFLGVLANARVCLAVWLCFGARSTSDKILAIVFPITAFVALGFEPSVRNLVPVTLGSVVGGAGLVGGMYWFIYLRPGVRSWRGLGARRVPVSVARDAAEFARSSAI